MFLPSFFTGNLIARFGVLKIMFAGVLLFACYIAFALSDLQFHSFAISLILLGVAWNFLFIGSTSLLTGTYTHEEKAKAQAINDMTVFVVGLICSFSAGALLDMIGWKTMNIALIPWLIITTLSLAWLHKKNKVIKKESFQLSFIILKSKYWFQFLCNFSLKPALTAATLSEYPEHELNHTVADFAQIFFIRVKLLKNILILLLQSFRV
jgi:MFS family permease